MFGIVPRPLWERRAPPDDRGRIVHGDARAAGRSRLGPADHRLRHRRSSLAPKADRHLRRRSHAAASNTRLPRPAYHLTSRSISSCPRTCTSTTVGGAVVPNGRWAASPIRPRPLRHSSRRVGRRPAARRPRPEASYVEDDFVPLAAAGVVDFFDDDREIKPGVRVVARLRPHRASSGRSTSSPRGSTAVFAADVVPTDAHVDDAWITAYDLLPQRVARLQAALPARGDRPRVPDLLLARPVHFRGLHPREGR